MKKATIVLSNLALSAVLVMSALGQTGQTGQSGQSGQKSAAKKNAPTGYSLSQSTKTAKHMTATKRDSDIQSCIESKMGSDQKLKNQGFNLSMNNGVATFTGTTKNSNSKSGVNSIAKSCGAKQVVNNISVEKAESSSPSSTGTSKKSKTKQ